ncbi:MAG: pyridoxamine 5'-phosphate oxidase family protein [Actinomycetota bacterium]|nr:pyridoxamine 5'-phosphate oxidase family protein [Actinomycetota bacterium]
MSIAVPLEELPAALAAYPWGYLVTVGDDQRAHTLAVPTVWSDGGLQASVGRTTRANVLARPQLTMVFPHPSPGEYSLIVDGDARVGDDGALELRPTWAVLHRPALPAGA